MVPAVIVAAAGGGPAGPLRSVCGSALAIDSDTLSVFGSASAVIRSVMVGEGRPSPFFCLRRSAITNAKRGSRNKSGMTNEAEADTRTGRSPRKLIVAGVEPAGAQAVFG